MLVTLNSLKIGSVITGISGGVGLMVSTGTLLRAISLISGEVDSLNLAIVKRNFSEGLGPSKKV